MAHNERGQGAESQMGHTPPDPGIRHVSARSTVTLRRPRPAKPATDLDFNTREREIREFLRFWKGESDTVTLSNVEIVEQPVDPNHQMTNQPSQEDHLDPDPRSVSGRVSHSSVAVRDVALPVTPWGGPSPRIYTGLPSESAMRARHRACRSSTLAAWCRPGIDKDHPLCRACFDELKDPIFLRCGHSYCRPCLNHLVGAGTTNKMSWPPRCCWAMPAVDIGSIQQHLDEAVYTRYLHVREEYSSRDPVYCSNKFCSGYIPASQVQHTEDKFVRCTKCRVQTCAECKQGRDDHVGVEGTTCKSLEELMDARDRKLAKAKQWKQCPACRILVERIDGCDQIQCSCGTRFCYRCGTETSSQLQCSCHPPLGWRPLAGPREVMHHQRKRVSISRQTTPRKLASNTDSSAPNPDSSSTSPLRERLRFPRSTRYRLPAPLSLVSRRASKVVSGASAADSDVSTPRPRDVTQPDPPRYPFLAEGQPGNNEGNKREVGNDEIAPLASPYGDSKTGFRPWGFSRYLSNPAHSNALWSPAPPMPPTFEQPPWLSFPSPNLLAGLPDVMSTMPTFSLRPLSPGPQPWPTPALHHGELSMFSEQMDYSRPDPYVRTAFRGANVKWQ